MGLKKGVDYNSSTIEFKNILDRILILMNHLQFVDQEVLMSSIYFA